MSSPQLSVYKVLLADVASMAVGEASERPWETYKSGLIYYTFLLCNY